ncbi:hypothetical protein T492DRAFT_864351 [Pavlovales sp. CCMP2436]|nr:hypothetical protein T492DRAFT_864351 [Pavlovales sp. CCMP2436]
MEVLLLPALIVLGFVLGLLLGVCAQPFHRWMCTCLKGRAFRQQMIAHAQRQAASEARWKSLCAASASDSRYFGELQAHLNHLEAVLKADERERAVMPPLPPSPRATTPPRKRFDPFVHFGKKSLTHVLLPPASSLTSTSPTNASDLSSAGSPQADEGARSFGNDEVVTALRELIDLRRKLLSARAV